MNKTRLLLWFIFVLPLPMQLQATHIVGGEMNYTCLGNDQYEITLTIFRDCYNGNPNAWFDDPASIGIFHGVTNELLNEILINWDFNLNDTLDPVLSSECFVAPPDVCVHTTTYTAIVNLPPQIGGYNLAYQRCCRNVTISNIVDPLGTGATFGVFISETALLECNSNPKFTAWPPLYICVNEAISFSQEAIDLDGDSIVYKLCTPLEGAEPGNPQPQPPNAPPYEEITWIDPPYNVNNMLNGTPGGTPLMIDEQTGLLTGIPNTIGQFVVGICVEEYRNGSLISTTRRDFQYNVGECGQTTASFFVPTQTCDGLTVDFDNQSLNATDFQWFFNYPDDPTATSNLPNPSYTYPDSGTYTIMLIAEPNTICADTSFEQMNVQYASLFPGFDYNVGACTDSIEIQLLDQSFDTISTIVDYFWEINTSPFITSEEQNPSFFVDESGTILVTLTVTAANGCQEIFQDFIPIELIEEELPADTLTLCLGDSIFLNPDFSDNYFFDWSPSEGLSDTDVGNPTASPDETTTYEVIITDDQGCQISRTITVFVPEPVLVEAPADTAVCDPTYTLVASSNTAIGYQWSNNEGFDPVLSETQQLEVTALGDTTLYVLGTDSYGCTNLDSVLLTGLGVNTQPDTMQFVCLGDSVEVFLFNQDPEDMLTYVWTPGSLVVEGQGTSSPIIQPTEAGPLFVYVQTENQFGCTWLDSIKLAVLDTLELDTFVYATQCSGFGVQFFNQSTSAPFYVWNFGDPNNPTAGSTDQNPFYEYSELGTYTVTLSLPSFVPCPDTISFEVEVGPPDINLDFDWDYVTCADTIEIQFQDLSQNSQSLFLQRQWLFSNGDESTLASPVVIITEPTTLEATLILDSSDGCVDTLTQVIEVEFITEELADSITICNNTPTPLNPDFNPAYSYEWMPSTGLDDANSPNPLANPSSTTTYTVIISSFAEDTCQIIREITAFVPPALTLEASGEEVICEEQTLLVASSNQAISYTWSDTPDFSNILSQDPEYLATPGRPTTYYVAVEDEFGCQQLDTLEVGNYAVEVDYSNFSTLCIRDTLEITVENLIPSDVLNFNWTPASALLAGLGTSTVIVSPTDDLVLNFEATNQYGCTETGSINVNLFDFTPPLDVTATPDTILLGETSQLNATLDPGYTYTWTPAETLDDPTVADPVAGPMETTTYLVQIQNEDGCSNERTVTVVVIDPICEEPFLFIPNAFSPNGDGKNDLFRVRGNFIDEVYLAVYNRWGELVYETKDPNGGWNGTYKGESLPPDVFAFYLEVRCLGGAEIFRKGNVTLLR